MRTDLESRGEPGLPESEARYRSLFESIDLGFCIIEVLFAPADGDNLRQAADYRFLEVNPAFIAQTGLADAVGHTVRELAPSHESHWFERYGHVALTGQPMRFEAPAEALGRWYEVFAFRVGDPDARQVAVLFNDIRAVKHAQREREELVTQLRTANVELRRLNSIARAAERRSIFLADLGNELQSLSDPDALMAATAQLLGEFLQVDRCAYAEVGVDEDAFTITGDYTRGDTISIVGAFTFRAFGAAVLRLMRANTPYVVNDVDRDVRITREDRIAYVSTQIRAVVCVPLHKDGRFVAAMAVHQRAPRVWTDEEIELVVTVVRRCWESLERARAYRSLREREAALRATSDQLAERTVAAERALRVAELAQQGAEAANRAKSDFLAVMSHELRTPLNAIGGYAELIDLGIHGEVTEPQHNALARIQASQRHLLGLINGVLNYSRMEAGAVIYHLEATPVRDALATANALVLPQIGARGLTYWSSIATPDLTVLADREKLQQILLNLLTNGIKFTEPGGQLRVHCEPRGDVVAFVVTDTGIGIPAEKLATIFDPFVQIDQRFIRQYDGVGLGLAISRDLARGMNGDLQVESVIGRGSTFTLTVPAEPEAPGGVASDRRTVA